MSGSAPRRDNGLPRRRTCGWTTSRPTSSTSCSTGWRRPGSPPTAPRRRAGAARTATPVPPVGPSDQLYVDAGAARPGPRRHRPLPARDPATSSPGRTSWPASTRAPPTWTRRAAVAGRARTSTRGRRADRRRPTTTADAGPDRSGSTSCATARRPARRRTPRGRRRPGRPLRAAAAAAAARPDRLGRFAWAGAARRPGRCWCWPRCSGCDLDGWVGLLAAGRPSWAGFVTLVARMKDRPAHGRRPGRRRRRLTAEPADEEPPA